MSVSAILAAGGGPALALAASQGGKVMDHRTKIIEREAKKAGFKGKINAKCCECIYDPLAEGTWRKQVENCTSFTCPLYSIRPVPAKGKE